MDPSHMNRNRKLYTVSSLLMAALFAVSASFQLNDIDWYFWIPLYAGGCAVNLMSCWKFQFHFQFQFQFQFQLMGRGKTIPIPWMAKLSLWLGMFLLVKVIAESFATVGIWSLDMRHRVVREKLGSGFVFVSIILQMASFRTQPNLYYQLGKGITAILGVSLICVVFLVLLAGSIIMHSASSTVQDDPWQFKLPNYVDYGTALVISAHYGIFFVLFLLLFTCTIFNGKTPASRFRQHSHSHTKEDRIQASIAYGMAALVGISYSLSVVFLVFAKDDIKF